MFADTAVSYELDQNELEGMPHVPRCASSRLGWSYWITVGIDPTTKEIFTVLSRFPAETHPRWAETELFTAIVNVWKHKGLGVVAGTA